MLLMGIVLGCVPLASFAQRQLVQVPPPSGKVLVRHLIAAPGDFIELCTAIKSGRAVDWEFDAQTPVTFNTHFHGEGRVKYPESMSAMSSAKGRLVPGGDHEYCWMWSNPTTAPVTIRVQLTP
ncbi:MAG: hypothetical protein ABL900_10975 [Burkholderiaceae bacterium]